MLLSTLAKAENSGTSPILRISVNLRFLNYYFKNQRFDDNLRQQVNCLESVKEVRNCILSCYTCSEVYNCSLF